MILITVKSHRSGSAKLNRSDKCIIGVFRHGTGGQNSIGANNITAIKYVSTARFSGGIFMLLTAVISEAETMEILSSKLEIMIPELLAENGFPDKNEISYEVLARKFSVTHATPIN
jgi:hypothetical protein